MDDWVLFAIAIILVAFVPSLLYLVWVRNTEKYSREPWGPVVRVFFYGSLISVIIAIALEIVLASFFDRNLERLYEFVGENPSIPMLILACVIAPFVEEAAKAVGVFRARSRRMLTELENGIVYGAAAGLGFAATENLLYEFSAYASDGAGAWIATAIVRSLSSALLHATASALFGFGIAKSGILRKSWLPYYLGAVGLHSAFNFSASFGALYESSLGDLAYMIGLSVAFIIAIMGFSMLRKKIRSLDTRHRRRRLK